MIYHLVRDSIKTEAESWAFSEWLDPLLHPASSRPGTPRHGCQIPSQTGVTQVRQWLVDRRILGSIKRKGRPRLDVKSVKLVTELNGKYL